jgi:hypothetical protein
MSFSIGGAIIKRLEMTKAHGLTPAGASVEAYGGDIFQSDSPVTLNVGSFTFNGIVTNCVEEVNEGRSLHITITDNRIKLQDDSVFCYFNGVEIIEDDPNTPGIDRKKRYWHIYPEDWQIQKKTYTDQPLTAAQIVQKVLAADTVTNGWSADTTNRFSNPVLGVDANNGKKLGSVIQEICDAVGVQMTLVGEFGLEFSVKGEGQTPTPPSDSGKDISDGVARGPNATRVTVVGDRNLYQELQIDLEPDWSDHFEQFWFKPAWIQHVIDWFGLSSDPSDRGEAEARAREITLREYIDQTGRTDVADYGTWGEVSRMEIPVWIYIDDIVFKAFSVPDNFQINGIPQTSLELRDGLLCAVEGSEDGSLNYKSGEFYPDSKAFCMVQGQPLSLYDPKTHDGITAAQFARMRELWQPNNRFNLDTKNQCVIFEEPLFVDSSGAPLFMQPNTGKSGLTSDVLNLVVPNAGASINAARVRASLCFEAEKFAAEFGGGDRSEPVYVSGLAMHSLLSSGSFVQEITYADDQGVDAIAQKIGDAVLTGQDEISSGGFTRMGAAGTELNGAIDRVTVIMYFESGGDDEGISERIEYSKERSPIHFESTLELKRREQSKDLFPGQKALQEEARQDRLLGKLLKEKKRQSDRGFETLDAFTTRLPGNRDSGAVYAYATSEGSLLVGMPVFVDTDGFVDQAKKRFAGVITTNGVTNQYGWKIPLASQGVVPVRVKGPVETGDSVGADSGDDFAKKNGKKFIGVALADYSGSETVVMPVRLSGAGVSIPETPFQVVLIPGADGADDKIGVISNSHLFNSEDKDIHEEDNSDWGLLNDERTDGGWSIEGVSVGDKIWLEIKLNKSDQSIAEINVRHGPVGSDDAWDEFPDPIAINVDDNTDPWQEYYNQIIAEITDPDEDPREGFTIEKGDGDSAVKMQVTQLLFTDVMMTTGRSTKDAAHPDLDLLVSMPWRTLPATAVSGNADPIVNHQMLSWAFGGNFEITNHYSFELIDADSDEASKILGSPADSDTSAILLLDGELNGELPTGMGNNDYILNCPNDDEADPGTKGENDIYLEVVYEPDGTITSRTINIVTPDNLPESEFGRLIIKLGYALNHKTYDADGNPVWDLIEVHNTICGDINVDLAPREKYGFQMFDASEPNLPKVLIMDGKVNGLDGSDHVPQGMGADDYILDVQDGWDIWLDIPYDPGTFEIIDPVTIAAGAAMPSDTQGATVAHSFIQIGYVDVETSQDEAVPQTIPHNSQCGDYYFKKPEESNVYSFKMLNASDGTTAKVRVLDGNVIDEDGGEHTPEGMGNDEFVRQVADDDAIFMSIYYDRATRQIIEPITIGVGEMPDDTEGMTAVEIGYVNVDYDGDGNAIVIPHNTLCGDFTFIIEDDPLYAFQLFDASETSPPGGPVYKVRVTDGNVIDRVGNEFTPTGMGEDTLTLGVDNDYEIWIEIPRDNKWNVTGPVTINSGSEVPDDTDSTNYVPIGYVNIANDGTLEVHNVQCGDYHFEPPPIINRYAFELIDASEEGDARVLIMDGQVIGPNDDGQLPAGMGGDNYFLSVFDGAEIYLVITIDNNSGDVTSVSIGIGSETPENTETSTTSTVYETIGYTAVDYSGAIPVVSPTNAICGDLILPPSLDVTGKDDEGIDTNFSDVRQLNFIGAVSVHHDPQDVNPNAVDIAIGPDVSDEDDHTVDNPTKLIFTRRPPPDIDDSDYIVEDVEGGQGQREAVIHVGGGIVLTDDEDNESVENCHQINFIGAVKVSDLGGGEGDVTIGVDVEDLADSHAPFANTMIFKTSTSGEQPELVEELDEGVAQITIPTVDVSDDINEAFVASVNEIHFQWAGQEDDIDQIVEDDGEGGALVNLLKLDVRADEGPGVAGVIELFFTNAPVGEGGEVVEEGESRQAIIHVQQGVDLTGDEGSVDNAQLINFVPADDPARGTIVVTQEGEGEANVDIPILPASEGGDIADPNVLAEIGGSAAWIPISEALDPYFGSDEFYQRITEIIYQFVNDGGIDDIFNDGRFDAHINDVIYEFVDGGGIDDLLADGRLDDIIESWMSDNFDIEDFVENIDLDVCDDGSLDTITVYGPLT